MPLQAPCPAGKHRRKKDSTTRTVTAYLMLAPNMLGLLLFVIVPIIAALYISLHSWNGFTDMEFVGLCNYGQALKDSKFLSSIKTTLWFVVIYVPSIFCAGMLLANFLASMRPRPQSLFRTLYFLPYAISTVIAGMMWSFMYDPMKGYLNKLLLSLGLPAQRFLASTSQALPSVAAVSVWMVLGYNTLIFLAAIKDIPMAYYESASIDGANSVHRFFRITVPLLKETSIFVIVTTTINSFQAFDLINVMTKGGPAFSTTTTVFYIYQQSFDTNRLGYASSIAFLLFLAVMAISLLQMKLLNSKEGQDAP